MVSIHALLAECDILWTLTYLSSNVSIHALLAECDGQDHVAPGHSGRFQSTHSLRSATEAVVMVPADKAVSIHALLAECDYTQLAG